MGTARAKGWMELSARVGVGRTMMWKLLKMMIGMTRREGMEMRKIGWERFWVVMGVVPVFEKFEGRQ